MSTINFVYNEMLFGIVNGVNKTFTSQYNIAQIEDLRLGGVDYTSFTFVGNVVTLSDAPTLSMGAPTMDYFLNVPSPTTTNVTFGTVIDDFYIRIGQNRLSRQYPIDLVKTYIKEGIRVINNLRTNRKTKILQFAFAKAPDLNTITDIVPGTTSFTISTPTSLVPTSGKLIIENNEVLDYSLVGDVITVNSLTSQYKANAKISFGYKLPSVFKTPGEVLLNERVLFPVDKTQYVLDETYNNRYTMVDDYVFLPFSYEENDTCTVWYISENYIPTLDTDLIDIHQDYYQVISLYALWNFLSDREDDRAKVQREKYDEQLKLYKAELRNAKGINISIHSAHLNNY